MGHSLEMQKGVENGHLFLPPMGLFFTTFFSRLRLPRSISKEFVCKMLNANFQPPTPIKRSGSAGRGFKRLFLGNPLPDSSFLRLSLSFCLFPDLHTFLSQKNTTKK
jgi:hypothetical protein